MTAVIRFHEVSKRYGAEVALDRFSLEVPAGSVFALLGENGAGKTTAIRILLGLAEPDSGQSEVLGLASASEGLEIRRRVGYVPEWLTLYEWMSVEEIGGSPPGSLANGSCPNIAGSSSSSACRRGGRSNRSRRACGPRWRCRWPWPTIRKCWSWTSRRPG